MVAPRRQPSHTHIELSRPVQFVGNGNAVILDGTPLLAFCMINLDMIRLIGPHTPSNHQRANSSKTSCPFSPDQQGDGRGSEFSILFLLPLTHFETQQPGHPLFLVQFVACINALPAIDATVINVGLARIKLNETSCHTIIALGALCGTTGIILHMQRLPGSEGVLPDSINARETAPEMPNHSNIQQDN